MSDRYLDYSPTLTVLQWLAQGDLASCLDRSVRLWKLFHLIYDQSKDDLTEFSYPDLRDRLFSSQHPQADKIKVQDLINSCPDINCICHRSLAELIFTVDPQIDKLTWCNLVTKTTRITSVELEQLLLNKPFAKVHRSIRDDLKLLVKLGFIQAINNHKYQRLSDQNLPLPPTTTNDHHLSPSYIGQAIEILQAVSFLQPSLPITIEHLAKIWQISSDTIAARRTFLHLDYIFSPETQERVDNYQDTLDAIWQHNETNMIQFDYQLKANHKVNIITYPVCLHYLQRGKYLTGYGQDPEGEINWHNYRLDRICSRKLKTLSWDDSLIPEDLQIMRQQGTLPVPIEVEEMLQEAWGFNFYYPKELLIIRFSRNFAQWYVKDTVRHPTFKLVHYHDLPKLLKKEIKDQGTREKIERRIKQCSPNDIYYQAWIRSQDINIIMRLRQWRSNGEVIAPLSVRKRLQDEANQELLNYQYGNTTETIEMK